MKKVWKIVVVALLTVAIVSLISSLIPSKKLKKAQESELSEYRITYRMVIDGEVQEIPKVLYWDSGSYPLGYSSEESVKIDDLRSGAFFGDEELEFYGWYLDDDLTLKFSGTIEQGQSGNVILYAKCGFALWTGFY